jgi:putative tricarboxylic transport membrane protein
MDRKRKDRDFIMGIIWILLGLTISIWSATFPFGDMEEPGPAWLPLALGIVLILLGIIMFFQARIPKEKNLARFTEPLFPRGGAAIRVACVLGGMLLYAALLEILGFGFTTFFLILFFMRTIEPQTWRVSVFYALIYGISFLFVFKVLLKTSLPSGLLGL